MENKPPTMEELLLKEKNESGTFKLVSTSKLKDLHSDIRQLITNLYKDVDPEKRLLGAILNASCTQGRESFLFSQTICNDLLSADQNMKRSSINGKEYRINMGKILSREYLKSIRESSKFGPKNDVNNAGILMINIFQIKQYLLSTFGEERLAKQNIDIIKYYEREHDKTTEEVDLSSLLEKSTNVNVNDHVSVNDNDHVNIKEKNLIEKYKDSWHPALNPKTNQPKYSLEGLDDLAVYKDLTFLDKRFQQYMRKWFETGKNIPKLSELQKIIVFHRDPEKHCIDGENITDLMRRIKNRYIKEGWSVK